MHTAIKVLIALLGLLLTIGAAQAQNPWGYPPPYGAPGAAQPRQPPPGNWQFRQAPQNNARGQAPTYTPPQAPGYQAAPGWQQYGTPYAQAQQGVARSPKIEIDVNNDRPYVQQNVLMRMRLVSDRNLKEATPSFSGVEEALFQKLAGPTPSTRDSGAGREIVNEFIYSMTPLQAGRLKIDGIQVTGKFADAYGRPGQEFTARLPHALGMDVRPAMASVRPWLPLQSLSVNAVLDKEGVVEEGEPVTLMLELKATGATGDHLPNLEPLLRSPDFRVYREQTMTDAELSRDRSHILGKRTEYYTLVPHSGGRLRLPQVRIGWWNTETATREFSTLPMRTFDVDGAAGLFGFSRSEEEKASGGWSIFWLPLIGIFLLLMGYWGGVWLRGLRRNAIPPLDEPESEPALRRLGSAMGRTRQDVGRRLAAGLGRLNPSRAVAATNRKLSSALPQSARLWMCMRSAAGATTPEDWCARFQDLSCRHLGFSHKAPMAEMAERIRRVRPGARHEQVKRLLLQLDGARYGDDDIDFPRWKRELNRAVRPGLGVLAGLTGNRVRRAGLPALNPQV